MNHQNFYVYVYIDPRNFQEFYYGKGQGSRKEAHKKDDGVSEKTQVLKEIEKEGLEPIVRVVARNLTEEQALLVEKTLIWKLGRTLTNKSSGHYADYFRPQNSLHKPMFGFDFQNGVYCLNVGEGDHRSWDDSLQYSFIAAGQNWQKYGRKLYALNPGDIVCAYLSEHGYVGIGRVTASACKVLDFKFKGRPITEYKLKQPRMLISKAGTDEGEHLIAVEWISTKDRKFAVGGSRPIWRSTGMMGSLENQKRTMDFLEKEFGISFVDLLRTTEQE